MTILLIHSSKFSGCYTLQHEMIGVLRTRVGGVRDVVRVASCGELTERLFIR